VRAARSRGGRRREARVGDDLSDGLHLDDLVRLPVDVRREPWRVLGQLERHPLESVHEGLGAPGAAGVEVREARALEEVGR
jgi:hypothetical protein